MDENGIEDQQEAWVFLAGNLDTGFEVYGPYPDPETAEADNIGWPGEPMQVWERTHEDGGAIARAEKFAETGDVEVLLEGLPEVTDLASLNESLPVIDVLTEDNTSHGEKIYEAEVVNIPGDEEIVVFTEVPSDPDLIDVSDDVVSEEDEEPAPAF